MREIEQARKHERKSNVKEDPLERAYRLSKEAFLDSTKGKVLSYIELPGNTNKENALLKQGVSPGKFAKAFRELKKEGVIVEEQGKDGIVTEIDNEKKEKMMREYLVDERVFGLIRDKPGLDKGQIAILSGKGTQTAGKLINNLEKVGLVRHERRYYLEKRYGYTKYFYFPYDFYDEGENKNKFKGRIIVESDKREAEGKERSRARASEIG